MQLKHVVFPAPFGPISPATSRARTSKEASGSAVTPPNRTVRLATCLEHHFRASMTAP